MDVSARHEGAYEIIEERPGWLEKERKWLEEVGLLVRKLQSVADDVQHQYNFINDSFFLDGERIANVDEIPMHFNYKTQQLVLGGERVSLGRRTLPLSKHRVGTLVTFMTPGQIKMQVLIFRVPSGGKGINQLLNSLEGSPDIMVKAVANKTGSMTLPLWRKCMAWFAQCTQDVRGENKLGEWTYPIALYVDNLSAHVNKSACSEAKTKYGIFIRTFMPGTSHLVQPVDQQVGITLKNGMKKVILEMDRILFGAGDLTNNAKDLKKMAPESKWRELIIRVVTDITTEVCILQIFLY